MNTIALGRQNKPANAPPVPDATLIQVWLMFG